MGPSSACSSRSARRPCSTRSMPRFGRGRPDDDERGERHTRAVYCDLGDRPRPIEVLAMPDPTPIVYVVDDDVSVRESLELLVKHAGWQPELFASAQEFLSRPRPTVPCCLVLDVTLPGLSGLELQEQLAERTDMPIIFITGYGDVPMTVRAMKAGAVEFLTKPFNEAVLLDAI